MPRRPPPTSLRLVPGPLPAKNAPKHPLPTLPRPTLLVPAICSRGQRVCLRQIPSTKVLPLENDIQGLHLFNKQQGLPASPVFPAPTAVRQGNSPKVPRGPWDHSGSVPLPFDVESLITPLKPVALR